MEELKALRSRLIALQAKPAPQKISDRNIVEIVQKLIQRYALPIIYTSTGKEYVMPSKLQQEILQEVQKSGRINILELPQILRVNMEHIEVNAGKVVSAHNGLYMIDGTIISDDYLDTISEEISDLLEETGQMTLMDVSYKYNLPTAFVKQMIEKRVGGVIRGQFRDKQNTLFTDIYVKRHLCRLRGMLRGASKPVALKDFDKTLVDQQVKSLIRSKDIKGTFNAGVFTPQIYLDSTKEELQSFYQSNNYIEYDFVKRVMGINQDKLVKTIIDNELGGGEHLDSVYVNDAFKQKLITDIREMLDGNPLINIYEGLQFGVNLQPEDIDRIIPDDIYRINEFILSDKFLNTCMEKITPRLAVFAEESKTPQKTGKRGKVKSSGISSQQVEQILKAQGVINRQNEDLGESLTELLMPKVVSHIEQLKKVQETPQNIDTDSFVNEFLNLQIYTRSLQIIERKFPNTKPLEVYLTKALTQTLFNQLLTIQLINSGFPNPGEIHPNQRQKFIKQLPQYLQQILTSLLETLTRKSPIEFVDTFFDNISNIPVVSVRSLDKKTQRALLHRMKMGHKEAALQSGVGNDHLALMLNLMKMRIIDKHSAAVFLPDEDWGVNLTIEIYRALGDKDELLSLSVLLTQVERDEAKAQELADITLRLMDTLR